MSETIQRFLPWTPTLKQSGRGIIKKCGKKSIYLGERVAPNDLKSAGNFMILKN